MSLLPTPDQYTRRYVAFLDVLGAKHLIEQSESDPEMLSNLNDALDRLYYSKPPWSRGEPIQVEKPTERLIRNRWQVHTFSDCVAMSTPATVEGLAWLLGEASRLAFDLLSAGIITRGGITVGSLIHDDAKVLGTALIEATTIERSADKPRVLASDGVLEDAAQSELTADGTQKASSLFRKDVDGRFFLDYLSWKASNIELNTIATPQGLVAAKAMWESSLEKARQSIVDRLDSETDPKHLARWLLGDDDVDGIGRGTAEDDVPVRLFGESLQRIGATRVLDRQRDRGLIFGPVAAGFDLGESRGREEQSEQEDKGCEFRHGRSLQSVEGSVGR